MNNEETKCEECGGIEVRPTSSCCGASIDSDILICHDCREHSEISVCETCGNNI